MSKFLIPPHVVRPTFKKYLTTSNCPEMDRSSLGYAILRALGAHENLSDEEINILMDWSNKYHESNGGITPHTRKLFKKTTTKLTFQDWIRKRLGPFYQADLAAPNAAAFPGDNKRPSYLKIFAQVWIDQDYQELCRALAKQ